MGASTRTAGKGWGHNQALLRQETFSCFTMKLQLTEYLKLTLRVAAAERALSSLHQRRGSHRQPRLTPFGLFSPWHRFLHGKRAHHGVRMLHPTQGSHSLRPRQREDFQHHAEEKGDLHWKQPQNLQLQTAGGKGCAFLL